MKKILVAALIAGPFISVEAQAQERAGSAALGAVSGAVVLGPVGAVAGAFIGYAGLNLGEYPNSDADMTYHVLNNSLIQLISETIGGDLVRPRLPPEDGSLFAH